MIALVLMSAALVAMGLVLLPWSRWMLALATNLEAAGHVGAVGIEGAHDSGDAGRGVKEWESLALTDCPAASGVVVAAAVSADVEVGVGTVAEAGAAGADASAVFLGDEPAACGDLAKLGSVVVETFASYGVGCSLRETFAGAAFATFEVTLEPGTKIGKVVGLADDLSLALGRRVRVGAGGGAGLVAIEVGLGSRGRVGLGSLLEESGYAGAGALPLCLGRDARGRGVFAGLEAMPHVLVAGSTGSGKSVALSAYLCSLLSARSARELRLVLIDPKGVELLSFAETPHCDAFVTDAAGGVEALEGMVAEMERRYGLFAGARCKNLAAYNASMGGVKGRLPWIVIVVDEYADLKMAGAHGKDVEALVCRLAQKSRAAGIHLVLATQRPSVDVISGVIKANFPARVAFRVGQAVDSRTVLDESGAEQLLGKGDCLCRIDGELVRVQCPMVTDEEVEAFVTVLRGES